MFPHCGQQCKKSPFITKASIRILLLNMTIPPPHLFYLRMVVTEPYFASVCALHSMNIRLFEPWTVLASIDVGTDIRAIRNDDIY